MPSDSQQQSLREEEITNRLNEFSRNVALTEQLYFELGVRYHQVPALSRTTPDTVDGAFIVVVHGGPVPRPYISRQGPISPNERIAVPDIIINLKKLNEIREGCKEHIDNEEFSKANTELTMGASLLRSSSQYLLSLQRSIMTAYREYDRSQNGGPILEIYRKDMFRAWLLELPETIRVSHVGEMGDQEAERAVERVMQRVTAVQEGPVDDISQLMGAVQMINEGSNEEVGQ